MGVESDSRSREWYCGITIVTAGASTRSKKVTKETRQVVRLLEGSAKKTTQKLANTSEQ